MKSNLLRVSIIAVVAAAAACAQSVNFKANVPFSFVVNGRMVQGGDVTIRLSSAPDALIIKSLGHGGVAVLTNGQEPGNPSEPPRLVFHRYGDSYFLDEVWGVAGYGCKLPQGNREQELSAKGPATTKTIALALQ